MCQCDELSLRLKYALCAFSALLTTTSEALSRAFIGRVTVKVMLVQRSSFFGFLVMPSVHNPNSLWICSGKFKVIGMETEV